jgi:hypothetical protein
MTVSVILQQIGWLATFIGDSGVENSELYFLIFSPFGIDRHQVSCGLVTKITTIQVKLQVDKYKNITRSTTCHLNARS